MEIVKRPNQYKHRRRGAGSYLEYLGEGPLPPVLGVLAPALPRGHRHHGLVFVKTHGLHGQGWTERINQTLSRLIDARSINICKYIIYPNIFLNRFHFWGC